MNWRLKLLLFLSYFHLWIGIKSWEDLNVIRVSLLIYIIVYHHYVRKHIGAIEKLEKILMAVKHASEFADILKQSNYLNFQETNVANNMFYVLF